MGPRADCRLAEAHLSGRRALPRVTRDDLSEPLHPGPWCLEERAVAAFEAHTNDASFTPPHTKNAGARPDYRHGLDPGAARLGGRPGLTGALGGGSALREPQQPDCDAGRTSYTLPDAGQSRQQRHRDGDQCLDQASA